ncbi:hypothetical protein [Streptomyces sp. NPDC055085]
MSLIKAWNGATGLLSKIPGVGDAVHIDELEHVKFSMGGVVPGFADGGMAGVLPGFAPGVDSIPAMLSPGEGILVPEAVLGLGPDFVYWANEFFAGGRVKYADGGVAGKPARVTSARRPSGDGGPRVVLEAGAFQFNNVTSEAVDRINDEFLPQFRMALAAGVADLD